ncbi:hypothetical protein MASR2M78_30930 [Treponema sp.]
MSDTESASLLGKKVFFLYPPSVIREDVVDRLLEQEFEVYMIRDHQSARRLLKTHPDSIVFINIDEGLTEAQWDAWIREVKSSEASSQVGIGIVSYNNDDDLRRKYLMDIGIGCGFIRLKLGAEESLRILQETLKANEAKGRRKYVRAACADDTLSSVNIRYSTGQVIGNIKDISAVGFSCSFSKDPGFSKNTLLSDVQLKLRGVLVRVEGIVFGTRTNGDLVYVVLFTNKIDGPSRGKIRRYIQTTLQAEIDMELKA